MSVWCRLSVHSCCVLYFGLFFDCCILVILAGFMIEVQVWDVLVSFLPFFSFGAEFVAFRVFFDALCLSGSGVSFL